MNKLLIIFAVLLPSLVFAQTYQIEASDDPSPVIRQTFSKIPEAARTKDTVLPTPQFSYGIQSKRHVTSFGIDTIKAAKMGSEPLPKLYHTYMRLGAGNYRTIFGEFNLMSTRSKNGAWGIHLGHISAGKGPQTVDSSFVAGQFSGYSSQNVDLFGKRFTKRHELNAGFGFNRDVVYNYGSTSEVNVFTRDYSRQKYLFYSGELGLRSFYNDSDAVNHSVRFGYNHLDNKAGVTEDRILFTANGNRYLHTQLLDATFGLDYNRVSGLGDTNASTIVKFIPRITAQGNRFNASAGIGIYHETNNGGATHFYPQFYVDYDIIDHIIIPYVSLGGSLERNNYRTLSQVNPFVSSAVGISLQNTSRQWDVEFGLKGTLSSQVFYQVSASRYELGNGVFYVNTTFAEDLGQNKFNVVYDDANVFHVGGQIGWQQRERIKVIAGADWFKYEMTNEAHPWHTPTLRINLLANYNIQDLIIVHSEFYYLNGQYARTGSAGNFGVQNMKGYFGFNVGGEYRYNKFFSAFVDFSFRNLGTQRYERWNGYAIQRFNFVGGLTYTF